MKRTKCTFFFITFIVFFFTASGFTQKRDYWLKIERKGIGYGYEHTVLRKLKDGNLEYKTRQHTKTDVAGFNPQDIILEGSYIVDANLVPISLDLHLKFRIKESYVKGKYKNGVMHLTIEDEEGKISKREIPFQDAYFDVVLGDMILKREEEKTFSLKIFDSAELKVNDNQVKITKSDEKEVKATITDYLTRNYCIDRKGQIKQIEFVESNVQAYQTDSKDAQDIDYLNTADGFTLTVSSKRSFPNVYKVVQAQIQVKWKDIAFEEFNFEDNRQKVSRKAQSNDDYEVILEITKPDPPTKEILVPIKDEKFATFLEDTEYIKPSDPSIQQQLAEIRGDKKNALMIVQNILHWISANIKTDMIAETLKGPEVLQKRKGKCSEYAILFASFARAAGIPTRIALGEVNSGNKWIGHMWDEVWLGQWIAVDPTAGIFVTAPSHIKFVGSPTVMGTQRVRWKLVDNLNLEILEFKEEKSEAAAEIKTGIFNHSYFNKTFSCKISAPDKSWTIEEEIRGGIVTVKMRSKDEKDITLALVLFPVPPGTSAKTILDGRVNAIAGMVKNFEKLDEEEIRIAGEKVPRVVFQHTGRAQELLVNDNSLLVDGVNAYLFAFITPKERFLELRPSLQKILENFQIIK